MFTFPPFMLDLRDWHGHREWRPNIVEFSQPDLPFVKSLPTPMATAPDLIQSATLSNDTPPVGMIRACGSGPCNALINDGPNALPGNNFRISTPASIAEIASVTVMTPAK